MRRPCLAIFLLVWAMHNLLGAHDMPTGDAEVMHQAAQSMARDGDLAIDMYWPPMSKYGANGNIYSQFALLPSLVSVPGVLVTDLLTTEQKHDSIQRPLIFHQVYYVAAGLLAVLVFLIVLELGASHARGLGLAMIVSFSSICFVYARTGYSEILQAVAATWMFWQALRLEKEATTKNVVLLALAAAVLFHCKLVFLPSAVLLVTWMCWRKQLARKEYLLAFGILVVGLVVYGLYNYARWDSLLNTGYNETIKQRGSTLTGLYGMLFSSGKSAFLYTPVLVAVPWSLWRLYREQTNVLVAIVILSAPAILYSAGQLSWSGDYGWGPRYTVFAVPVLLSTIAFIRPPRWTLITLVALGVVIQALGASFAWNHFTHITRDVTQTWLGQPDRKAAKFGMQREGHCGACIEDQYAHRYLPQFNPVAGHYWLLKHKLLDHDWQTADANAPWPKSEAQVFAGQRYRAASINWWLLYAPLAAGLVLVGLFLTMIIIAVRQLRILMGQAC